MNLTNTSTPTPTTGTRTPNTSNSTHGGRRLLFDLTLEYVFTALFQIEKGDTPTYAKIQNFTYQAKNEINTIIDASEYRIVINQVDLTPGYFTAAGTALAKCSDGAYPTPDSISKELGCKANIIAEVATKVTSAYWVPIVIVLGVVALAGAALARYRNRKCVESTTAVKAVHVSAPPYALEAFPAFDAAGLCLFPPRLQFPATVTFEYHLLPGHSV